MANVPVDGEASCREDGGAFQLDDSRAPGALLMAFKLLDMAQQHLLKLNGVDLLPLVRAGVRCVDGARQEREKRTNERMGKAAWS